MVTTAEANELQANHQLGVITSMPAGELRTYERVGGQGIFADQSGLALNVQSGKMDIVFAEDNVVYMKNIIFNSNFAYGASWVQGRLSDDGTTITVPMGQSIFWSDYYQADVVLGMGTTEIVFVDGQPDHIEFTVDDRAIEVTYQIDGDQITLLGTDGSDSEEQDWSRWNAYGLGCYWTDDNSFGDCLEWHTVLNRTETSIIPTVIYDQPEGELATYNRVGLSIFTGYFGVQSSWIDGKMNIVYGTDGKVYIQNPLWWNRSYNTWVWGDFDPETGIISVPTGQYLMYSESADLGVQLLWGNSILYQDENGYYMYEYFIDEDATEILYKIDGDKLLLLGCEGDPNAEFPEYYNATGLLGHFSDGSNMTCLEYVGPDQIAGILLNIVPAVPANPTDLIWQDRGTADGTTALRFVLPTTDVDGNILEQEFISYSIFTDDDQIYTFDAASYGSIDEDITEVPYSLWSQYWNFTPTQVSFFRTNHSDDPIFDNRIGIQVYYTVNGVRNASDIVYINAGDLQPVVPANPEASYWYDYAEYGSNYGYFSYSLPTTDIDGNPIDQYYLSFSVFTDDDQIYTFKASDYPNDLTEDVTEIPSSIFFNSWNISSYSTYLYYTEAPFFTHQVGIQAYYTIDGVRNASDIVYLEVFPPVIPEDPHMQGYWLVAIDANGEEVWYEMYEGANGDYTTTLSLDYDTYGYVYYDAQNPGERHNVDYYIMIDGVRYGANDEEVATVLGTALDNQLVEGEGFYTLPVGYNYNMGVAINPEGNEYYVYAAQAGFTGVDELNAGKTVANVRYFNVMGQEVAQPEGIIIQVTTYTDGTTCAVKVMK